MTRIVIAALAAGLLLSGCAPGNARSGVHAPGPDIETVPGPTENVTSMVLRPAVLSPTVDLAARPVELAFGAYLARMNTEAGTRHHLALLVQLRGDEQSLNLDLGRGLLVEVDGVQYVADLALSGNSFLMQRTDRGRELTLSFPVDRDGLERLTRARDVRVSVGGSCYFRLSARDQERLRAFADRLPPEQVDGLRTLVAVAETDG